MEIWDPALAFKLIRKVIKLDVLTTFNKTTLANGLGVELLPSYSHLIQRDSDGSGRHSCKCNYADTVWVCPAPMLTQFECARRLCLHCSLSLSEPGPYADTVCVKPGPPCWHKFKVETMKQSKISSFSNKTVTMGYEQRQPTFPPTQI